MPPRAESLDALPGLGVSARRRLRRAGLRTSRDLRALARQVGWGALPVPSSTRAYLRWRPRRSLSRWEAKEAAKSLKKSVRLLVGKRAISGVRSEAIGSVRRKKARTKDVDLLVFVPRLTTRVRSFELALAGKKNEIKEVYATGGRRISAIVQVTIPRAPPRRARRGPAGTRTLRIRTDFFFAEPSERPFALLHFTGPWRYNVRLRAHAQSRGLKLNQYGIWKGSRNIGKGLRSERAVVAAVGASYYEPADRIG